MLMHGFPDNLHIYDDVVPYLVAGGRRVVVFDFIGFGASDKPAGAKYSFEQQLGDLHAVVESLGLDKIVPVGMIHPVPRRSTMRSNIRSMSIPFAYSTGLSLVTIRYSGTSRYGYVRRRVSKSMTYNFFTHFLEKLKGRKQDDE
ncbi:MULTISPECIES: alpha/beta fold hydrolase [unclassified Paenibacillus]|uniref:alpha/beta fold hydrolase n=1 Tax=unclassified Paenibacillus TaxID=185978 RepID=UPI002789DE55|nr:MULTISPECIES: alpha/beta fold hydrolase [unclassified Paenibacillus]MDQ0899063.1 alpha-beta hydrolase superfamily lysophospholipase [Paenibacillus sp. V4I7]MDQ0914952.1 alpha-beta hydrolase superfamily lysophospholipase [Paenibacillus sp. V4I5]